METWECASRWINQCTLKHVKCNNLTNGTKLPTRLLEVRPTGADPELRLYIPASDVPPSRYITLSHCWGKLPIPTLKSSNFEAMTRDIAIAKLPKTFQDAITITRRLNIRYLWIDSLCIVQDSVDDWQSESVKMRDVYSNSFLNIAAAAAPDGRTGCFLDRNALLAGPCRATVRTLHGRLCDLVSQTLWVNGMAKTPLSQRSWVVQERLLAPRVLYFAQNQLYWECNVLVSCSCLSLLNSILGFGHYTSTAT
jgi:hypothetical protein